MNKTNKDELPAKVRNFFRALTEVCLWSDRKKVARNLLEFVYRAYFGRLEATLIRVRRFLLVSDVYYIGTSVSPTFFLFCRAQVAGIRVSSGSKAHPAT